VTEGTYDPQTQRYTAAALKVLEDLRDRTLQVSEEYIHRHSTGDGISARYFKQVMLVSECNGRISELRGKGFDIESSKEKDKFGFVYHRLAPATALSMEEWFHKLPDNQPVARPNEKHPGRVPAGVFPLILRVKEQNSCQCKLSYVHVDGNLNRITSFIFVTGLAKPVRSISRANAGSHPCSSSAQPVSQVPTGRRVHSTRDHCLPIALKKFCRKRYSFSVAALSA